MYSQGREEEHILMCAGQLPGRFLDIGAYDGKTFSNTLALVERGWIGVCVEADPGVFSALQKQHKNHPQVTLLHALVGTQSQIRKFYSNGGAIATSEESHYQLWKKSAEYQTIYMQELPLSMLFKSFPGPYDFINIDTEGTSAKLLHQIDLKGLGARIVCVEHDGQLAECIRYCQAHGLSEIYHNAENLIAAK